MPPQRSSPARANAPAERAALAPPIVADPNPGLARALLHGAYDLSWALATLLGSPWLAWRGLTRRGFARMIGERLGRGLPRLPARRRLMVHGVSVGEIKGALPLVRAAQAADPALEVVISATTDTGLAVARQLFPELLVVRFPADLSPIVARFLGALRPSAVVLVELEIWPNFLREANRRGIPLAVVNGRITDRSYARYRWFRDLLPQFNRISLYCVQSEEYAARFVQLHVDRSRLVITGNLKFDGLATGARAATAELASCLGARAGQLVVVGGSTHEPEESLLLEAVRVGCPDARLILVPRHPGRCEKLAAAGGPLGGRVQRLSDLRAGRARPDPALPALVDTIGELEQVYALADLVYVGGTLLPHGGQNMLEPAAQGKPVLLGPSVHNFAQEAKLLLDCGAARSVRDVRELADALRELAGDAALRARMGAAGCAAVQAQRGATQQTLAALQRVCLGAPG